MTRFKINIILMLVVLTSCEDFVDVPLPSSQLTGEIVFEDHNTATAALVNIYSKLRDTGILSGSLSGSPTELGLYSDELTYYGQAGAAMQATYQNNLLASTASVQQLWNDSFHQIYCANAVIEGVENSSSLELADKETLRGEALFIRALVHFYLANLYGSIPYITTTNHNENRLSSRLDTSIVYELITADLAEAIALLPQDYISAERVRPNKSTAYALLARTYLYMGLWPEASNAASAVINNPEYVWETDLNKIFLKESTTTIWQLKPQFAGNNTQEGSAFIFLNGPPLNTAISAALLNSFEAGDQRKIHWIREVEMGSTVWHHSYKYKEHTTTGTSVEYSILFRLAEQYLIRAEARARQGELISALEDLNLIRITAGLPPTSAQTQSAIIDAVLVERRHELFTEYGHRFFDLKRNGLLDATLLPVKSGWNTTDQLWPIPELELLANPNLLPQNPGY